MLSGYCLVLGIGVEVGNVVFHNASYPISVRMIFQHFMSVRRLFVCQSRSFHSSGQISDQFLLQLSSALRSFHSFEAAVGSGQYTFPPLGGLERAWEA